jgi:UDP-N-acetyl-D-glucosamine dehydrogenase
MVKTNKKLVVFGQGYVGLPLAVAASEVGFEVTGIDINLDKVLDISKGISPIEDISSNQLKDLINSGNYKITSELAVSSDTNLICICVPTPLDKNHKPDLTALKQAVRAAGKGLKPGMLVIVESTISPGTTRKMLLPILVDASGLSAEQFHLAYSPERIDPLNKEWNIENTPKLIAGLTNEAANLAREFYSKFVDQVVTCPTVEVAETAKLLENSYRLVNISFINEISMFCQKMGIDINEVVKAAATKPYGFMPFYPSVGVGGHCIPVDPIYLSDAAKSAGAGSRFIDLADEINQAMPSYFVERAKQIIDGVKGKKILVIGLSYKPNVADVRESPVISLIEQLRKAGAEVFWHDELVKSWNGQESTPISSDFDLAIIATPHDYLGLSDLKDVPILNTRSSI